MQTRINLTKSILLRSNSTEKEKGIGKLFLKIEVRSAYGYSQAEISLGKKVAIKDWNGHKDTRKGSEASAINAAVEDATVKLNEIEKDLRVRHAEYDAAEVKNLYLGKSIDTHTLMTAFDHYEQFDLKDAKETLKYYYKLARKYVEEFLGNGKDINIHKCTRDWLKTFEFWLKDTKDLEPTSASKYLEKIMKVVRATLYFDQPWLSIDPYRNYELVSEFKQKPALDIEEQTKLAGTKLTGLQERVRDVFLLMCLTGFEWSRAKNLKETDVIRQGSTVLLKTNRQKTDERSTVPLCADVIAILAKYKDHPLLEEGYLLPVHPTATMNRQLKEIAELAFGKESHWKNDL